MERRGPMEWIVPWFWGTLITAALIAILLPVFPQTGSDPHRPLPLARVKQTATGLIIYTSDYDDLLPNGSARDTTIAQTRPYTKADYIWEEISEKSGPIQFNFNVAGVSTLASPLGYGPAYPIDEVAMLYSLADPDDKPGKAYRAAFDTSAKLVTIPELTDSLNLQFDRTGVTLAPTDYLADQDPLK